MINPEHRPERQESKPILRSEELFQGGKEIIIRHGNEQYRMFITKSGKLILNK